MGRTFSEYDKKIFFKLVPESNGSIRSLNGHDFPYILRPLSHRFSKDGDDFKNRISKLTKEELNYISDLILSNKEDLLGLEEEDIYSLLDIIEKKISTDKKKLILNHIGLL